MRISVFAKPSEGQTPEGDPKVHVVERVDERIDGAVYPAKPGQSHLNVLGDGITMQEGDEEVINEEGKPTGDKSSHHHTQCLSGLRFPFEGTDPDRHPVLCPVVVGI